MKQSVKFRPSRQASGYAAGLQSSTKAWIREVDWVDAVFLAHMYILSLITSFSFNVFNIKTGIFTIGLLIDFVFITACFFKNAKAFAASVLAIAFILFSIAVFSERFGAQFVVNQAASYVPAYSIGVFGFYAMRRNLSRALAVIFLASLAYELTFLYQHFTVNPDQIMYERKFDPTASRGFIRTHDAFNNGNLNFRVFVSDFHFMICLIYACAKLKERKSVGFFICVLLTIYCSWVSDFRFAAVSLLFVSIILFIQIKNNLKILCGLMVVMITMLVQLFMAIFSINIYQFVRSDFTGSARYFEAELGNNLFRSYPIFGMGLAGNSLDMYRGIGGSIFAASDLGYLGILSIFGLFGYATFCAINIAIAVFSLRVNTSSRTSETVKIVVTHAYLYVVLEQFLSTYILEGGGAIFVALSLGYWMRYSNQKWSYRFGRKRAGAVGRSTGSNLTISEHGN